MRWDTAASTSTDLLGLQPPPLLKAVAFSPTGRPLAAGVERDRLRVWDPSTAKELCTLKWHSANFACVLFGHNAELLASDSKAVKVWDTSTGREIDSLDTGEEDDVCSVAVSFDGKRLATGYVHGEVKVWDLDG
jgi:WD40 repeat protein